MKFCQYLLRNIMYYPLFGQSSEIFCSSYRQPQLQLRRVALRRLVNKGKLVSFEEFVVLPHRMNRNVLGSPFINYNLNFKHIQILCFKFHQNRTINEEFHFWGVKRERYPNFKKNGKTPYRMVVLLHTKSFSSLAKLASV